MHKRHWMNGPSMVLWKFSPLHRGTTDRADVLLLLCHLQVQQELKEAVQGIFCSSKIFHWPQLSNWTHIWKVLVVIFQDDFFVSSFVCFLSCLNQCECFELLPFWRRMKLLHWWITSHMLSIEIYMCNLRNQFVFVAKTRSLSVSAGATFPVDRGTIGLPFLVGKIINPTWLK